jgi:hypothetical protein
MKTYGEIQVFVTPAMVEDDWSASRPGSVTPGERAHPVDIGYEAGCAPDPVWTSWTSENS